MSEQKCSSCGGERHGNGTFVHARGCPEACKTGEAREGAHAGELEFRFRRDGSMLAIDFCIPSSEPWLTGMLWSTRQKASPATLANVHAPLSKCYLRAPAPDLAAAIVISGCSFGLRPSEYEALRAHLLVEGLVHHVPESAAKIDLQTQQAAAPVERPWGIFLQFAEHRDVLLESGAWCNESHDGGFPPRRFVTAQEAHRFRRRESLHEKAFVSRIKPLEVVRGDGKRVAVSVPANDRGTP